MTIRKLKTTTAPMATMVMFEMMKVIAKLAGALSAIAITIMMMGAMMKMITLTMMQVVTMPTELAAKTAGFCRYGRS